MLDRRRVLAVSAAALGAPAAAAARQAGASGGVDVAALLAETGAPALAGLVTDADQVIAQVVGGVRRAGGNDPATTADPWHLGSNTKAMTAALYARLVEAGKARWGATLAELFPDVRLDPTLAAASIEQLLSHRAGLTDAALTEGGWLMKAHGDKRPTGVQRAELAQRVLTAPPSGAPGTFAYANVNYILVGAAIERMAGASWEDEIRARLFRPLGMASAGFGAPRGDAPWGHFASPGGAMAPLDPSGPADNPPALGPAGTAHMTLADHARFLRSFLKDNAVLSADSRRRLTTPAPGATYALGWRVLPERPWSRGPILAHEGSNTFWHEVALVAPGRGAAIVTACNLGPEPSRQAAVRLAQQLQAAHLA